MVVLNLYSPSIIVAKGMLPSVVALHIFKRSSLLAGKSLVASNLQTQSTDRPNDDIFSQPEVPAEREPTDMPLSQPIEPSPRSVRQANAAKRMETLRQARGYLPAVQRGLYSKK